MVDDPNLELFAAVRLAPVPAGTDQERLGVVEVVLRSIDVDWTLDVAALRRFPIAWVETTANMPELSEAITARMAEPASLQLVAGGLMDQAYDELAAGIDARAVVGLPAPHARPARLGLPDVGKGQPYPDSFYEAVAERYRGYVRSGLPPATAVAEDTGAPVTTVHRWIRECRRRGLLAPARSRGRAG